MGRLQNIKHRENNCIFVPILNFQLLSAYLIFSKYWHFAFHKHSSWVWFIFQKSRYLYHKKGKFFQNLALKSKLFTHKIDYWNSHIWQFLTPHTHLNATFSNPKTVYWTTATSHQLRNESLMLFPEARKFSSREQWSREIRIVCSRTLSLWHSVIALMANVAETIFHCLKDLKTNTI